MALSSTAARSSYPLSAACVAERRGEALVQLRRAIVVFVAPAQAAVGMGSRQADRVWRRRMMARRNFERDAWTRGRARRERQRSVTLPAHTSEFVGLCQFGPLDRKSVVWGTSVSVSVNLSARGNHTKKT